METVHTERVGNYLLTIHPDVDPGNPRKEWDNLGKMVCWHRRYNLGDEQPRCDPEEYWYLQLDDDPAAVAIVKAIARKRDRETVKLDHTTRSDGKRHDYYNEKVSDWIYDYDIDPVWVLRKVGWVILPLYLYDHGGITMRIGSFRDPWDSGQVGWIYASPDMIEKEYGTLDIVKAEQLLRSEVETYDQYLTGDVYGYRIFKLDNPEEYEDLDDDEIDTDELQELDSCWGFFGLKYCIEEAKRVIDYYVTKDNQLVNQEVA